MIYRKERKAPGSRGIHAWSAQRPGAFDLSSRRKRRWWWRIGALSLVLVPMGGALYGYVRLRQSPYAAIEAAREALMQARATQAERYAASLWEQAQRSWNQALAQWQKANQRWWAWQQYTQVQAVARQAEQQAWAAARRAEQVRDSLHQQSTQLLHELTPRLDSLSQWLEALPYRSAWNQQLQEAQTHYRTARKALENGDLWGAAGQAAEAHQRLNELEQQVRDYVQHYLKALPTWQQWVEEARREARRSGSLLLVVEKIARRCYVYRGAQHIATFTVELGPNWMGPKLYAGDRATPEGRYRVIRKLGPGETRYYRALLLDYPNAADRTRFDQARREGRLPPNARIGGLIEIHGEGGRGVDWTEGCVALRNEEMRQLFELVPVGTPVVIVGALEPPGWLTSRLKGNLTASYGR
jgi:hypothetical protein